MDVFTLYDENPEDFEEDYIVDDDGSWEEDRWWDDRTWSVDDCNDDVEEVEDMPNEDDTDPIHDEVKNEFSQFQRTLE